MPRWLRVGAHIFDRDKVRQVNRTAMGSTKLEVVLEIGGQLKAISFHGREADALWTAFAASSDTLLEDGRIQLRATASQYPLAAEKPSEAAQPPPPLRKEP
jgi:hypothetical protein